MLRKLAATLVVATVAASILAPTTGRREAAAAEPFRLVVPALAADSPPPPAPFVTASGVRSCDYIPGFSAPAPMPSDVVNATPPSGPAPAALPGNTAVPGATTSHQLTVLDQLSDAVSRNYVDPAFNGIDWGAVTARYRTLVQGGLTDTDFYVAMGAMLGELGDDHSQFMSPADVAAEEERLARGENFVGIGALMAAIPGRDGAFAIISVWPNSPARQAGLKPHDIILSVDGSPAIDAEGNVATRGPAGTTVMLVVETPGQSPRSVQLVRRAVSGFTPVDSCILPNTKIGYIFIPTFNDLSIDDQVRDALKKLTAEGPLTGLIVDNRQNGGGISTVAKAVLGFFTGGNQGAMVSSAGSTPFNITPEDVGGSQTVPLVVLVDWGTVSFGEIVSGVLAQSGRATIVGRTSLGNVELLHGFNFTGGSRAWIAAETFQPLGKPAGYWEQTGIVASVSAPTRWDLFTEANDPALAKAAGLLSHHP